MEATKNIFIGATGPAGPADDMQQAQRNQEKRNEIEKLIQALSHACKCRNAGCEIPACLKMKRVVGHTRLCKLKAMGGCSICKQLCNLCIVHAKLCREGAACTVSFCAIAKKQLNKNDINGRVGDMETLFRRISINNKRTTLPIGMQSKYRLVRGANGVVYKIMVQPSEKFPTGCVLSPKPKAHL